MRVMLRVLYLAPFADIIGVTLIVPQDKYHVDQAVKVTEEYIRDGSVALRSLRGSPTNRRRIASNADIDVAYKKLPTLAIDGRELQGNENLTEALLSIIKDDGISSCKGILIQPDWIMTSGRCADGALNITAWIGVNDTSMLPADNITADSEVERFFIAQEDINISPGYNSTKSDGNFAMLHLNVASNKTAAFESSDFETSLEKGYYYYYYYCWYWYY